MAIILVITHYYQSLLQAIYSLDRSQVNGSGSHMQNIYHHPMYWGNISQRQNRATQENLTFPFTGKMFLHESGDGTAVVK